MRQLRSSPASSLLASSRSVCADDLTHGVEIAGGLDRPLPILLRIKMEHVPIACCVDSPWRGASIGDERRSVERVAVIIGRLPLRQTREQPVGACTLGVAVADLHVIGRPRLAAARAHSSKASPSYRPSRARPPSSMSRHAVSVTPMVQNR